MSFNEECDECGLDTISSGAVVGLAMDLTEKGIHDFGVRFGDADNYVRMPELIATQAGRRAPSSRWACASSAEKYGVPELSMEVKNLEMPGYDPRGAFGMSIGYATSDRGGCHMRTYSVGDEVVSGAMPAATMEGKVEGVIGNRPPDFIGQNFSSDQVLRHLVRLLGGQPRAGLAGVQAHLRARSSATTRSC